MAILQSTLHLLQMMTEVQKHSSVNNIRHQTQLVGMDTVLIHRYETTSVLISNKFLSYFETYPMA